MLITILLPVSEGRPGYHRLAVTVDSQLAAPQPVSPSVNDVAGVHHQGRALIQPESDDTLLRQVDDVEPVGGVDIPSLYYDHLKSFSFFSVGLGLVTYGRSSSSSKPLTKSHIIIGAFLGPLVFEVAYTTSVSGFPQNCSLTRNRNLLSKK